MAFAAPVLVEGAAAGESAAAASGVRAAGASRAATGGATSARTARSAPARNGFGGAKPPAGPKASDQIAARRAQRAATAAGRADELVAAGTNRTQARRILRSELGASLEQADDLLDAAEARRPSSPEPAPAGDAPLGSASPAGKSTSTQVQEAVGRQIGRGIGNGLNAGGGLLLGAIGYVLGTVYLRSGGAGLKAWFLAKFLNKTTSTSSSAGITFGQNAAPATGGGSNAGTGLQVLGTAPNAIGAAGNGVPSTSGGGGW